MFQIIDFYKLSIKKVYGMFPAIANWCQFQGVVHKLLLVVSFAHLGSSSYPSFTDPTPASAWRFAPSFVLSVPKMVLYLVLLI